MLRFYLLFPAVVRLHQRLLPMINSFTFPEGGRPNISDASSFESAEGLNDTDLSVQVENMLNYTLYDKTKWEEMVKWAKYEINEDTHSCHKEEHYSL